VKGGRRLLSVAPGSSLLAMLFPRLIYGPAIAVCVTEGGFSQLWKTNGFLKLALLMSVWEAVDCIFSMFRTR
jgi:hypothetical protein